MGTQKSFNNPIVPRRVDNATGQEGEITINVAGTRAFVHDGRTRGGIPLVDTVPINAHRLSSTITRANDRPLRIIGIGDSIMQNNSAVIDGQWQIGSGLWETSLLLSQGLGAQYEYIANMGIGGQTTAQILARWQSDVIAQNPDVVFIIAGTNDLLVGQAQVEYTNTMNNIEQMVIMSMIAGISVILCTPPVKDLAPVETRTAQVFYYDLAEYYGLPLLDLFRITCDAKTGNYKTGYSDDGVHPNRLGIKACAAEGAKLLSNPRNYVNRPYFATYSEVLSGNLSNILPNGSFAQQTTPGAPDNWSVGATSATYTCNTDAVQPYTGKDLVFTQTAAAQQYLLYGQNIANGMASGDKLQVTGRLKITGQTELTANGVTIDFGWDSGSNSRPINVWPYNGDFVFNQEIIVPKNYGTLVPTVFVQDAAVYTFDSMTLVNKTARRRIWQPGQQT